MNSAANALLKSVQTALSSDATLGALIGAGGMRDRIVAGKHLPAVVVGETTTTDYSTATEPGEEHVLVLEVWSDSAGRRQAEEIAALIIGLLHDAPLTLDAHALVNLRHVSTKTRQEAKARLFCAEMRFRAVTEPTA